MLGKLVAPKSEDEITKHWKYTDKTYISVICITYNHGDYLTEAIESFLAQKSEYKFEIIVHDDASIDNTTSILKAISRKYPTIIKPIYNAENQYSQNVNLPISNCNSLAKGAYIAFCEGDDYWVDEYKLQRQIKFLEKHHQYGLVLTDYHNYDQSTQAIKYNLISSNLEQHLSRLNFESFLTHFGYFSPMTWLVRSDLWHEVTNHNEQHLDGTFVWLLKVLKISQVKVLTNATAVHRLLPESASHSNNVEKLLTRNESLLETQMWFHEEYKLEPSLIEQFLKVHFLLNLNTVASRKITRGAFFKVLTGFKFSYLSSMNKMQILSLISIFIPLPNKIKTMINNFVKSIKNQKVNQDR
ncbi:glycosyltransferase family 2 protein [Vibrio campbellii]|uniref:glycosyltransferase family 2 protein n=1 Tax=Vibrio campbellii TaxID=680 RepID=UPI0005ED62A1|nr:glycosyltransferase family 2 protein [Vibrio campbellii]